MIFRWFFLTDYIAFGLHIVAPSSLLSLFLALFGLNKLQPSKVAKEWSNIPVCPLKLYTSDASAARIQLSI